MQGAKKRSVALINMTVEFPQETSIHNEQESAGSSAEIDMDSQDLSPSQHFPRKLQGLGAPQSLSNSGGGKADRSLSSAEKSSEDDHSILDKPVDKHTVSERLRASQKDAIETTVGGRDQASRTLPQSLGPEKARPSSQASAHAKLYRRGRTLPRKAAASRQRMLTSGILQVADLSSASEPTKAQNANSSTALSRGRYTVTLAVFSSRDLNRMVRISKSQALDQNKIRSDEMVPMIKGLKRRTAMNSISPVIQALVQSKTFVENESFELSNDEDADTTATQTTKKPTRARKCPTKQKNVQNLATSRKPSPPAQRLDLNSSPTRTPKRKALVSPQEPKKKTAASTRACRTVKPARYAETSDDDHRLEVHEVNLNTRTEDELHVSLADAQEDFSSNPREQAQLARAVRSNGNDHQLPNPIHDGQLPCETPQRSVTRNRNASILPVSGKACQKTPIVHFTKNGPANQATLSSSPSKNGAAVNVSASLSAASENKNDDTPGRETVVGEENYTSRGETPITEDDIDRTPQPPPSTSCSRPQAISVERADVATGEDQVKGNGSVDHASTSRSETMLLHFNDSQGFQNKSKQLKLAHPHVESVSSKEALATAINTNPILNVASESPRQQLPPRSSTTYERGCQGDKNVANGSIPDAAEPTPATVEEFCFTLNHNEPQEKGSEYEDSEDNRDPTEEWSAGSAIDHGSHNRQITQVQTRPSAPNFDEEEQPRRKGLTIPVRNIIESQRGSIGINDILDESFTTSQKRINTISFRSKVVAAAHSPAQSSLNLTNAVAGAHAKQVSQHGSVSHDATMENNTSRNSSKECHPVLRASPAMVRPSMNSDPVVTRPTRYSGTKIVAQTKPESPSRVSEEPLRKNEPGSGLHAAALQARAATCNMLPPPRPNSHECFTPQQQHHRAKASWHDTSKAHGTRLAQIERLKNTNRAVSVRLRRSTTVDHGSLKRSGEISNAHKSSVAHVQKVTYASYGAPVRIKKGVTAEPGPYRTCQVQAPGTPRPFRTRLNIESSKMEENLEEERQGMSKDKRSSATSADKSMTWVNEEGAPVWEHSGSSMRGGREERSLGTDGLSAASSPVDSPPIARHRTARSTLELGTRESQRGLIHAIIQITNVSASSHTMLYVNPQTGTSVPIRRRRRCCPCQG